jgi:shikimate 5-dehydrogenase
MINLHTREHAFTQTYTNKLYEQVLKGDNTDWLGIQRPVKARLEAEGRPTRGGTALIVGAGGAAMGGMYAMQQLGMKVIHYTSVHLCFTYKYIFCLRLCTCV